jgi:hypothetical protein
MGFGMFKSYVACKTMGLAVPHMYDVSAPHTDFPRLFAECSANDAREVLQAELFRQAARQCDVYVGPHTVVHLLRAFNLEAATPTHLKTLMLREYVAVYPLVSRIACTPDLRSALRECVCVFVGVCGCVCV